jgi:tRNA-specific 2-thiouridylase
VLSIEPVSNTVVVGGREDLAVGELGCIRATWTGEPVAGRWRGEAQFRAHGIPQPASFEAVGDGLRVTFDEPASGVAPGQTVVAYDGDRVVGSAVIAETSR